MNSEEVGREKRTFFTNRRFCDIIMAESRNITMPQGITSLICGANLHHSLQTNDFML